MSLFKKKKKNDENRMNIEIERCAKIVNTPDFESKIISGLINPESIVRITNLQILEGIGKKAIRFTPAVIQAAMDDLGNKMLGEMIKGFHKEYLGHPDTSLPGLNINFFMNQCVETLKSITGEDFGKDLGKWQKWWEEQKE